MGRRVVGVGGLVAGSALLVWETRLILAIVAEETDRHLERARTTVGHAPGG